MNFLLYLLSTIIMLMVDMNPPSPPANPQEKYDFILNPSKPPKKKLVPANSFKTRLLLIIGGVIFLIFAISIVMRFLGNAGKAETQTLVSIAQKQQEIIRISGLGLQKSRTPQVRHLAINAQLSLMSGQAPLLASIKGAGQKVDNKLLDKGKNSKTDLLLNEAAQNNNFDAVFARILQESLEDYQRALKTAYNNAGPKTKETLKAQYDTAELLASQKISR